MSRIVECGSRMVLQDAGGMPFDDTCSSTTTTAGIGIGRDHRGESPLVRCRQRHESNLLCTKKGVQGLSPY